MQFSVLAVAAFAAGVMAASNDTVYTTEVVTAYTTYCPEATSIVHGNKTYTVSEVRSPMLAAGRVCGPGLKPHDCCI